MSIKTQQIKSTTQKIKNHENFIPINVLKWNNSKWKTLCPYFLTTDGQEENFNSGAVIFENFYQGSKVYDVVYSNIVYPSRYHVNNPQYVWWKFVTLDKLRRINELKADQRITREIRETGVSGEGYTELPETIVDGTITEDSIIDESAVPDNGDRLLDAEENIDYDLYDRWKNSLWLCPHPIRYPNSINRRQNTQFSLITDKHGNERRLDYIAARKELYCKEYIRLVRVLPEYQQLLADLRQGKNLLICEVDVPVKGKKGEYGRDCDADGNCLMTLAKLEIMLNDPQEAFGHGLCLAMALLEDLEHRT